MKNRRFKHDYRENASKLHKAVGDILRSSEVFKLWKVYQEYPVNRVNPSFQSGREKFDWVILDLAVVLECHGEQHYRPVNFGGIPDDEAVANFHQQQRRDIRKEDAAIDAGFGYIAIKFSDEVSEERLISLVKENIGSASLARQLKTEATAKRDLKAAYQKQKQYLEESGIAQKRRDRSRQVRQDRYQSAKAWKKQWLAGGNDND